jgi:hypothetical protein
VDKNDPRFRRVAQAEKVEAVARKFKEQLDEVLALVKAGDAVRAAKLFRRRDNHQIRHTFDRLGVELDRVAVCERDAEAYRPTPARREPEHVG